MKIFELENESVLSLFEPSKRVDLDLPANGLADRCRRASIQASRLPL